MKYSCFLVKGGQTYFSHLTLDWSGKKILQLVIINSVLPKKSNKLEMNKYS